MKLRMTRGALFALSAATLLLTAGCPDDTTPANDTGTADAGADLSRTDKGPGADLSGTDGPTSDMPVNSDAASGDGGATKVDCDPAKAGCESLPGPCKDGEVRAVVNGCWGACVPIEQCADLPEKPDCNITTGITCKSAVPSCLPGYVPTRQGTCYGPCVPIGTCACVSGGPPEQCPDKAYICHSSGRCGVLGP
jgi:hypothetical protein